MINTIVSIFSYTFSLRAVIVGSLVSLTAALLGVILVLKRYSMIGDGLSHVGFSAIAIGAALGVAPLYVAIPVVIICAFLLLRNDGKGLVKGDSAIALLSSSALAIGIVVAQMSNNFDKDFNSYMFGDILSLSESDVIIAIILSIIVLGIFIIFYNKIFTVTFDEGFATATGTKTKVYNSIIALLTAVTIVIGMRIMGTLLISALIIFPALSSMRLFKGFRSVIISSGIISIFCFIVGIILSFTFGDLPTGASIVCVNLIVFIINFILGKILKRS